MKRLSSVGLKLWMAFGVATWRLGAWLFARRREIAICATVVTALWIMWLHSENGRYGFVSGKRDAVIDTRDGTLYTFVGYGEWLERHPRTGKSELHERPKPPAPPSLAPLEER